MLSLRRLPWLNLRGYPARTTALLALSALMAMAVFGGTLIIQGVRQGLEATESRLGADILVTPADSATEFDAQSILIQAEPGYFYMPASTLEEVATIPGVEAASPQLFLASARSSCCSGRYQIIAFDPDSDFIIQPWIADTLSDTDIGQLDIVVGSNIAIDTGESFRLFGNDCRVVGQFSPTGSSLDNAIYTNFDTAKILIDSSISKGLNKYGDVDTDNVISSVAVRVEPGYDIEQVATAIMAGVGGVSVATSTNMIAGIADSLGAISRTVAVASGIVWVIGLTMIVLVFGMTVNERKREFATLVALGASRRTISRMVRHEAIAVSLMGGVAGVLIAGVGLGSFTGAIGQALGVGLVLPPVGTLAALAVMALASALIAAALASAVAVRIVNRLDAGHLLKEGQ
ncbi:ABC transporter permease [Actinomyces sp. MRS3W]|uniref:ABC transporter permease n=1 Tax=Actinomyces sp. MRS3W TaxID=2800796 RepID=UPI0028FD511E|nr:ABC transporter permease [Actinomyces sp. MRS3W]MDU0349798.1 ABC transporter permease [Actinomyces sp. MRS3W]